MVRTGWRPLTYQTRRSCGPDGNRALRVRTCDEFIARSHGPQSHIPRKEEEEDGKANMRMAVAASEDPVSTIVRADGVPVAQHGTGTARITFREGFSFLIVGSVRVSRMKLTWARRCRWSVRLPPAWRARCGGSGRVFASIRTVSGVSLSVSRGDISCVRCLCTSDTRR